LPSRNTANPSYSQHHNPGTAYDAPYIAHVAYPIHGQQQHQQQQQQQHQQQHYTSYDQYGPSSSSEDELTAAVEATAAAGESAMQ
jgi:hypothetical protein